MSTAATTTTTAAELMRMPDFPPYALFDGELVAMSPAGGEHGQIAGEIYGLLWMHNRGRPLGRVFAAETGYLLTRDPDMVLAPDVSFVATNRVPTGKDRRGYMPLAPDLAVEVVSPNDRRGEVERKIAKWLDAGTRIVWVVWIDQEQVTVHRRGKAVNTFGPSDLLDGGDVLSGFSTKVAAFFE